MGVSLLGNSATVQLQGGTLCQDVSGVMREHYVNELGIQTGDGPCHPKYWTVESRLQTFTDWPPGMSQIPQLVSTILVRLGQHKVHLH